MTGRERLLFKIPTKNPQPLPAAVSWRAPAGGPLARLSLEVMPGGQAAGGLTVYPPKPGEQRWRAVWYEPDGQRGQCQAVTEGRLAAKLEPVARRLAAEAPNMLRSGAELIAHYLWPDRLPVDRRWSRRHAETQRYLCARFVAPVIGERACQDIKVRHMQAAVNAASAAELGGKVRALVSALVAVGIAGGYLVNPGLSRSTGRPAVAHVLRSAAGWRGAREVRPDGVAVFQPAGQPSRIGGGGHRGHQVLFPATGLTGTPSLRSEGGRGACGVTSETVPLALGLLCFGSLAGGLDGGPRWRCRRRA